MESMRGWADAIGNLNWLADLNGLGVLASVLSLFLSLGSILFTRRVLRIVRNQNHVLQYLAQAHARLRRLSPSPGGGMVKGWSPEALRANGNGQESVRDALHAVTNGIGQFVGDVLDQDCFAYLEIGLCLQRRGEVAAAAWFFKEAVKQDELDRCLSPGQRRGCLEEFEDCLVALGRIREALEARRKRLRLLSKRKRPSPSRLWDNEVFSKLSMYLSVPFKFAKYVILGTISLAFGPGTLLVIRRY